MDEQTRQLPNVHPGLNVRQSGNFISVRQKPDQDGGWGTLRQPKVFNLPFLKKHQLRSRLGFEAVPASEFWQFTTTARIRLRVDQLSDDRYANSVGVALLDANNVRVAPLVQSNSGRGEEVEIGPGTFKVVASLGIAENLKDLVFEFLASPVGGSLRGGALIDGYGIGHLMQHLFSAPVIVAGRPVVGGTITPHRSLLRGWSKGEINGHGVLRQYVHQPLQAYGVALIDGWAHLNNRHSTLRGMVLGLLPAYGKLSRVWPVALKGHGDVGPFSARGSLRQVRWLDEPQFNWRARVNAGVVELNRPYVHFAVDQPSIERLLFWLRDLLAAPDGGDFNIPESDTGLPFEYDGGDFDTGLSSTEGDEESLDGGLFP